MQPPNDRPPPGDGNRAGIAWERIGLILLGAGQAQRFGGNKLAADLLGQTLLERSAAPLLALPFARRIMVTAPGASDAPDGFAAVRLPETGLPQSRSLACGMDAMLRHMGPAHALAGILIALADMPLVTAAHYEALRRRFDGAGAVCSTDGQAPMPPAIFPPPAWPALAGQQGDRGGRGLLAGAAAVTACAGELMDIDLPADLDRAADLLRLREAPASG